MRKQQQSPRTEVKVQPVLEIRPKEDIPIISLWGQVSHLCLRYVKIFFFSINLANYFASAEYLNIFEYTLMIDRSHDIK